MQSAQKLCLDDRGTTMTTQDQSYTNLLKAVESACKGMKTAQDVVHGVAVRILIHVHQHGSGLELANKLVRGLGNGVKAEGLARWFKENGGFICRKPEDGFTSLQKGYQALIEAKLAEAKDKPWYKMVKVETPFKGVSIEGIVEAALRQAESALKKKATLHQQGDIAKCDLIQVTPEQVQALRRALEAVK